MIKEEKALMLLHRSDVVAGREASREIIDAVLLDSVAVATEKFKSNVVAASILAKSKTEDELLIEFLTSVAQAQGFLTLNQIKISISETPDFYPPANVDHIKKITDAVGSTGVMIQDEIVAPHLEVVLELNVHNQELSFLSNLKFTLSLCISSRKTR